MKRLLFKTVNDKVTFLGEVVDYIDNHKVPEVVDQADQCEKNLECDEIVKSLNFFKTFEIDVIPASSISMEMKDLEEIKLIYFNW